MDQDDIDGLRDAATSTLEALSAILIDDFDCDDSGAREHVVEREDA